MTDTLYADVSEWQRPVNDSYPYPVLAIRATDGTYVDHNFATNYAWMRNALDSGKLTFGIVYTYVRPGNWQANAQAVIDTINANGGLDPRVAIMLDVESGGNGRYNQSAAINGLYDKMADYTGNPARVIGYGNVGDLNTMWPQQPPGLRLVIAGYGNNPDYPGKVAHQYTDGNGYGGGLPEGAPPFGNCDMNSADGLTPKQFAAACGIDTGDTAAFARPTRSQIEGWRTDFLTTLGKQWTARAAGWEGAFHGAKRAVAQPHWTGAAAAAAHDRAESDLAGAAAAADALRGLASVAHGGATDLVALRRSALDAIAEATDAGFVVDEDLSVRDTTDSAALARQSQAEAFAQDIARKADALLVRDADVAAGLHAGLADLAPHLTAPLAVSGRKNVVPLGRSTGFASPRAK